MIGILKAVTEAIIVTTPDPTALVDAYATIRKLMHQAAPDTRIRVILSTMPSNCAMPSVFSNNCTQRRHAFCNGYIEHLGTVPHDDELIDAVREQRPVVQYAPETAASRAFRQIARHLEITQTRRDKRSPLRSGAC
ncbi:MAG: hypothetical protein U0Y68_05810 [Blastocatellia bacterium]